MMEFSRNKFLQLLPQNAVNSSKFAFTVQKFGEISSTVHAGKVKLGAYNLVLRVLIYFLYP